jgi:hypothetical protein
MSNALKVDLACYRGEAEYQRAGIIEGTTQGYHGGHGCVVNGSVGYWVVPLLASKVICDILVTHLRIVYEAVPAASG